MAGNPAGNAITNEIMYMANMLGRGRVPYGGAAYNALQGASNFLNRAGIGTRGVKPGQQAPTDAQLRAEGYGFGVREYDPLGTGLRVPPAPILPPPQGYLPAAERAYQSNRSSVAQQAAQNPEFQRYEAARLKAAAPGATPEQVQSAEDIGMQIWQQKYGSTPMGQPGGAVGRFNPLMDRTFGYQAGSAPGQQMGAPTLGPSPLVPQVDQSLNPASPNFIGGEGAPLMDFTRENVTPELIAAYQKQLLEQAAANRK